MAQGHEHAENPKPVQDKLQHEEQREKVVHQQEQQKHDLHHGGTMPNALDQAARGHAQGENQQKYEKQQIHEKKQSGTAPNTLDKVAREQQQHHKPQHVEKPQLDNKQQRAERQDNSFKTMQKIIDRDGIAANPKERPDLKNIPVSSAEGKKIREEAREIRDSKTLGYDAKLSMLYDKGVISSDEYRNAHVRPYQPLFGLDPDRTPDGKAFDNQFLPKPPTLPAELVNKLTSMAGPDSNNGENADAKVKTVQLKENKDTAERDNHLLTNQRVIEARADAASRVERSNLPNVPDKQTANDKSLQGHQSQQQEKPQQHDKQQSGTAPNALDKVAREQQQEKSQQHDKQRYRSEQQNVLTPNALDKAARGQQQEKSQQQEKPQQYEKQQSQQQKDDQFKKAVDKRLEDASWNKNNPAARMIVENIVRSKTAETRSGDNLQTSQKGTLDPFSHFEKIREAGKEGEYEKAVGALIDYNNFNKAYPGFEQIYWAIIGSAASHELTLDNKGDYSIHSAREGMLADQIGKEVLEGSAEKFLMWVGKESVKEIMELGLIMYEVAKILFDEIPKEDFLKDRSREAEAKKFNIKVTLVIRDVAEKMIQDGVKQTFRGNQDQLHDPIPLAENINDLFRDYNKLWPEASKYLQREDELKNGPHPSYPQFLPPR